MQRVFCLMITAIAVLLVSGTDARAFGGCGGLFKGRIAKRDGRLFPRVSQFFLDRAVARAERLSAVTGNHAQGFAPQTSAVCSSCSNVSNEDALALMGFAKSGSVCTGPDCQK